MAEYDISKIDRNFAAARESTADGMRFYELPHPAFALYGVYFDGECFRRLPQDIADATNEGVGTLCRHTAGGRVRFATDARKITLRISYPYLSKMGHMTLAGQAGFALLEENGECSKLVKMFVPPIDANSGFSMSFDLFGEMKNYILHFPLYNPVSTLTVGLNEDAALCAGLAYRDIKPILYYGSSITQGGCASRPDTAYQNVIALWNNIDFLNLGFSGSARGEATMVEYLAGIDCSLFVCDYDHNAPTLAHLEATHYPLYERFRAAHPDTPILLVTRPDFYFERCDDRKREAIVRKTYSRARAAGDKNVHFLAGRSFFTEDRYLCTVDGAHPTDRGFYLMAKKIYRAMRKIDPIFG